MKDFLVSAVIPVYNAEAFLKKAVLALLNEEEVAEIVLVDDASTDHSWKVCKELEDDYEIVKAFKHPDGKNHGCGASRNYGFTLTTHDYIVFADADNFILPNRFKKDKEIFLSDSSADGVYNAMGVYYYSEKAKTEFIETINMETLTFTGPVKPEEVFKVLIGLHEVSGSWGIDALTIKRELFKLCGGFNTELKLQQDVDLFVKMSLVGRLFPGILNEPTCLRGVHENHRSTDTLKMNYYRKQRWVSIDKWIRQNDSISSDRKNLFFQEYSRFKIMSSKGLKAVSVLIGESLNNPGIIKKSYGIFDFGFWHAFGKNKLTLSMVSFKNKFFKTDN